ncbi:MAG: glutamine--fructose-6-phosphate transaminase (isomerizing) [endosymbiont of Galathealinum brachiosum]|uniref:Glutamine--fructose-6-phosphate aminotransferase [isomerizing] n=1 Tax=endosymbiont of Galathealinum brachiosum TaxID=2200906 RepID=A0A370DJA2_9GAMM|nr:MAG: glutamine--fructose-6-phosphate transaminase (isomerizing) [endosymbiont of Galathealinum brachiosum]
MCGIVGAVAERNVTPILLEGLRRLEYRGYDSAGIAVINDESCLDRVRRVGKVENLSDSLKDHPLKGFLGIAHTRWATHGEPSEPNAHPHICNNSVAVVHNGIIENHGALRELQKANGYSFTSETDTEVVVHQVELYKKAGDDLLQAVKKAANDFEGAYALGVVSIDEPGRLITTRSGSPLVIGVGFGEYFIASDVAALLPVTQRFIFLEEGDIADITKDSLVIYDKNDQPVEREISTSELTADAVSRGEFRHYMMKEIHEQPVVLGEVLEGRIYDDKVLDTAFGADAAAIFDEVKRVQIIACGTSFHAGMVARYWLESLAGIPCNVEVASEFRYRDPVITDDTLIVTISQSGETADTLAALRNLQDKSEHSLAICNVPESSLVRESKLVLMTRAGPEIGVASTKAFTTQLVGLMLMTLALGKRHGLSDEKEKQLIKDLKSLPSIIEKVLDDNHIEDWADEFKDTLNSIFLGRGVQYPIAMEGALKLKEISYIHAEAYAAGELKHGPLALVDPEMPIIAVAPKDGMEDKLKSNLMEVIARSGEVYLFADERLDMSDMGDMCHVMTVPAVEPEVAPILYAIPMQLFSYYVAVRKGTDVDQPRNLAKSVTVE